MKHLLRPTRAEIDLRNLEHNARVLAEQAGESELMAVVKANAYGHGVIPCAKTVIKAGAKWLAVATPEEALEVAGLGVPVLTLSPTGAAAAEEMVAHDVRVCTFLPEHLQYMSAAAKKLKKKAKVHLKIDTGMGRIGLRTPQQMADYMAALDKNIEFEGMFTHFATADEADTSFTKVQIGLFRMFAQQAHDAGYSPKLHASNSAGILMYPEAHLDIVRMGISLYGYPPSGELAEVSSALLPVLSLKSELSYVKSIASGDSVSYGRTFIAKDATRVATVPIGYADGFNRLLSNKGSAIVRGVKVPIIGRVCMDQIMLDVTSVPGAQTGDTVTFIGRDGNEQLTADDMAELCGTISYEILCDISSRVPRVYVDN